MTENVPPEPPQHRLPSLLASLQHCEGFQGWFLPCLQRRARRLELELTGDLEEKASVQKRAQYALLRELFTMAGDQAACLKAAGDAAAAPVPTRPGLA